MATKPKKRGVTLGYTPALAESHHLLKSISDPCKTPVIWGT